MTTPSYSTCWDLTRRGFCPRGDQCKWDHDAPTQLYPNSPERKSDGPPALSIPDESQFCWNYAKSGSCPRGNGCRWIHELIMLPWPSPASLVELPSTPESCWDQFDTNNRLFGTTSSYDPSLYTTPLVMDNLSPDQIAKAEELSKVALPSQRLDQSCQQGSSCPFCKQSFASVPLLIEHCSKILQSAEDSPCTDEGAKVVRAVAKRKSWIVVQESLPAGLVSQIEGLYKRQITSSTNVQMMVEALQKSADLDEETREYLVSELAALVALSAKPSLPST